LLGLYLLLLLEDGRASFGSLGKPHPNCRHIDNLGSNLGIDRQSSQLQTLPCPAAVFYRFYHQPHIPKLFTTSTPTTLVNEWFPN
jgi:hypothetical protein